MLAYAFLLLATLLLYAVATGRGKAVWQAIIGQAVAGNPSSVQDVATQAAP